MFGSDQMIWPESIGMAIEALESASFLSEQQKRDIFYNNAAEFQNLSEEEIRAHCNEAANRQLRIISQSAFLENEYAIPCPKPTSHLILHHDCQLLTKLTDAV